MVLLSPTFCPALEQTVGLNLWGPQWTPRYLTRHILENHASLMIYTQSVPDLLKWIFEFLSVLTHRSPSLTRRSASPALTLGPRDKNVEYKHHDATIDQPYVSRCHLSSHANFNARART